MRDLEASIHEQRHSQGVANMVKTLSDLERYRHLLATVRPAWVIEAGSYNGSSAAWFADVGQCQVVSIDTHPQLTDEAADHPSVIWLTGNSTHPHVVDTVRLIVGTDSPVMVVLDSDHSAEHVYAEMLSYAPMVTVGSYLVVEDGVVEFIPEQLAVYKNSSPLQAIEHFLAVNPLDWEIDDAIEDMFPTTQHPKGFIHRVS